MHIEQAKQQLTAGRYLPAVRHAFARHWQQQQDFASWLDYMICKRQWGYALSSCHTQQALRWQQQPVWQRWWQGIYRHRARQLANLIAEAQCDTQTTPAIVKAYQQQVKCWRAQQQQNLQQLGQRLTSGSVAVVGNSPNLAGQQLGATIDRHDTVIR
ncbi:MAG: hypothetical protein CMF12_05925, partial [Idiomarina sp.]